MRFIFLIIFITTASISSSLPKDYYQITNTATMKEYFYNHLVLLVTKENNKIIQDRKFVQHFFYQKDMPQYKKTIESKRFQDIKNRYKLKDTDTIGIYLKKIDIVPISIVLTQAATESGWGKSRFFKEANNIFGRWTWKSKGLVPNNRDDGLKHKIKIYDSLESSINDYLLNLNIGWAYKDFRNLRATLRRNHMNLHGSILAPTLINYSQRKEKYTQLLVKMIKQDQLERFDKE